MTPHDVQGLIRDSDGEALAKLAAGVPADQAIVEIGAFTGKGTCFLASAAPLGVQVYAVDVWDLGGDTPVTGTTGPTIAATRAQSKELFLANVAACGLTDRIVPIQARSTDAGRAWDGPPVGLLVIDGDHSTAGVKADIHAWFRHLAYGATVLFDDYNSRRSVRESVTELGYPIQLLNGRYALIRPRGGL